MHRVYSSSTKPHYEPLRMSMVLLTKVLNRCQAVKRGNLLHYKQRYCVDWGRIQCVDGGQVGLLRKTTAPQQ